MLKLYSIGCPPFKTMAHAAKPPYDVIAQEHHAGRQKNFQSFANEVEFSRV